MENQHHYDEDYDEEDYDEEYQKFYRSINLLIDELIKFILIMLFIIAIIFIVKNTTIVLSEVNMPEDCCFFEQCRNLKMMFQNYFEFPENLDKLNFLNKKYKI
jgi:hypothetical protein